MTTATTHTSTAPEENKSNDRFQWTPELQELYISDLEDELRKNSLLPHFFRKKFVESHTPKPQAEMNEHHDTNLTYDSCKDCDELAKEVLRLSKKINELNGLNSALQYANSQISEHNKAIIKDLKETREQLRVSILWENFPTWIVNNYDSDNDYSNHFVEKDRRGQAFSRGIDWAELKKRYAELNNL